MRPRGLWGMSCWNALSGEQQRRLIEVGNLPFGYDAEGSACDRPADCQIETADDAALGPRFYCYACGSAFLAGKKLAKGLPLARSMAQGEGMETTETPMGNSPATVTEMQRWTLTQIGSQADTLRSAYASLMARAERVVYDLDRGFRPESFSHQTPMDIWKAEAALETALSMAHRSFGPEGRELVEGAVSHGERWVWDNTKVEGS